MIALGKAADGSVTWTQVFNNNWAAIESELNAERRQIRWAIQKNGGLATFNNMGFTTAPTDEGTLSNLNDATGQYVNFATAAHSDRDGGLLASAFTIVQTQNKPIFTMVVKTGANAADLQTCRIWCGLFSGDPMASNTPSVHLAAFRYAPAADLTAYWRCVTDSGSGAPTVTATSVAIATDTRYVLQVDATDPASIKFYINGVLVATHTTELPTTTQSLGYCVELRTLSATARNLRIAKLHLEHQ